MKKFITDIFGKQIEVTDLKLAIEQIERFVSMSKYSDIKFEHGKKKVNCLEFYEHQLKELNKLK